jgi:hypothetical protein
MPMRESLTIMYSDHMRDRDDMMISIVGRMHDNWMKHHRIHLFCRDKYGIPSGILLFHHNETDHPTSGYVRQSAQIVYG